MGHPAPKKKKATKSKVIATTPASQFVYFCCLVFIAIFFFDGFMRGQLRMHARTTATWNVPPWGRIVCLLIVLASLAGAAVILVRGLAALANQ